MLNKSTIALSGLVLLIGMAPALALAAGSPAPLIGVGALASGAVAAAVVVARYLTKR